MFTGLIEEVGSVAAVRHAGDASRLIVSAPRIGPTCAIGDSISVNGVDLTAKHFDEEGFSANVMPETYRCSNLGDLKPGDKVNLERPMQLAGRVSGHPVRRVL